MNKNKKARVVIILIMLAVIAGIGAGVFALIGVFHSGKTEALELLAQMPEKFFQSSVAEYVGGEEINAAFMENGGTVNMKFSDLQIDETTLTQLFTGESVQSSEFAGKSMMGTVLSDMLSVSDYALELNTQYDLDSGRTSNSAAVSKGDEKISVILCTDEDEEWISLPELIDGKVFHVTGDERKKFRKESEGLEESGRPTGKQMVTLFSKLKSYVAEQMTGIRENISCEKMTKRNLEPKGDSGYLLVLSQDTVNSFLNGFSDILTDEENEYFQTIGQKMSDWKVDRDIEIYVYGENGNLQSVEFTVAAAGEEYPAAFSFESEDNHSSSVFNISGVISETPMCLTVKCTDETGNNCKTTAEISITADEEQILHTNWTETIVPDDDTYKLQADVSFGGNRSFAVEASGTIKDLKAGVCVSNILDDVKISMNDKELAALAVDASISSRDSSLEIPQGEIVELTTDTTDEEMEQYTNELQKNLQAVLSKMGLSDIALLGGLM
jgi:hypothetical protein